MISVLLPTRERPELAKASLESLISTASAPLDIIVRLDDDDPSSYNLPVKPIIGPRHGYTGLHHYVNEMAAVAKGDWLLLWNDDAEMLTPSWDKHVERYSGQFKVLNPRTNHGQGLMIFPLIPRQWVEVLGHWSLSMHNDSWVEQIAHELGIVQHVSVLVQHNRFDLTGHNRDNIYMDTHSSYQTAEFFGPEMTALRAQDAAKLKRYMEER